MNTPIQSGNTDLPNQPPRTWLDTEREDSSTPPRPARGVASTLRALVASARKAMLIGREVQPINVWIAAFGALAVGIPTVSLLMVSVLLLGGVSGVDSFSLSGVLLAAAGVLLLSVWAAVFGLLPALLVSVPICALLAARGWMTTLTAGLAGALPGLLLCAISDDIGGAFLLYGTPIGVLTYSFSLWLERKNPRLHQAEPKRHG